MRWWCVLLSLSPDNVALIVIPPNFGKEMVTNIFVYKYFAVKTTNQQQQRYGSKVRQILSCEYMKVSSM